MLRQNVKKELLEQNKSMKKIKAMSTNFKQAEWLSYFTLGGIKYSIYLYMLCMVI